MFKSNKHTTLKNSELNLKNLFNQKRLVFMAGGEINPESREKPKEKAKANPNEPEIIADLGQREVHSRFQDNALRALEELAHTAYPDDKGKEKTAYNVLLHNLAKKPGVWKEAREAHCLSIGIKKGNDGKYNFVFFKDEAATAPLGSEVQLTSNAQAATKEAAPAKDEKVKATVNTGLVRAQLAKEERSETEAQERAAYIGPDNIVHLVREEDGKKVDKTREITLTTLYKNPENGFQVLVTSKYSKKTKTATYDAVKKDFVDEKGRHVAILDGDTVIPTAETGFKTPKPKAPEGQKLVEGEKDARRLTAEQVAQIEAGTFSFNQIAEAIMKEHPEIAKNGYSTTEYARILAGTLDRNSGYYWVIQPGKKTQLASAQEEIDQEKGGAKARGKKGQKEADEKSYEKYRTQKKDILNNNSYLTKGGKKFDVKNSRGETVKMSFDDLVDDPATWKEAWNNNYPINATLIKEAFNHAPYNKIPENMLRDTLQKALSTGRNGMSMSTLFKYFNKDGTLYRTTDGKPGDLGDLKDEMEMAAKISGKIAKNKKEGKSEMSNLDSDEKQYYSKYMLSGRAKELDQITIGAAGIFDALVHCVKGLDQAPKLAPTPKFKGVAPGMERYNQYIFDNKSMDVPRRLDNYVNDEAKWNDMWDKNKGNIQILKNALQQYPFNKLSLGAAKVRVREAMHSAVGDNEMSMEDLFDALNQDGVIYKKLDGTPGEYDDLIEEFNKNKGKKTTRNEELRSILYGAAPIFDAITKLDPDSQYNPTEGLRQEEKPTVTLDALFPSADYGSINGKNQDYSDTHSEAGVRVAGGGIFTGGLFKYDFREREKGISKIDLSTSNATINRIISDQCGLNEGEVNGDRLKNRFNELIRLGIASLMIKPEDKDNKDEVAQKKEALRALGMSQSDLENPTKESKAIATLGKTHEVKDFDRPLTQAQQDLIKLGFLLEMDAKPNEFKSAETTRESHEWVTELSDDPQTRELQRQALAMGAKPEDLPKIEKHLHDSMIAIFNLNLKENLKGISEVGITVPIEITKGVYLGVNGGYDAANKEFIVRGGIGAGVEIVKGLTAGVGAAVGSDGNVTGGVGVNWEIPIDDSAWSTNISIGGGVSASVEDLSRNSVLLGAALSFKRDPGRQLEQDVKERLEKTGFAAVEKATDVHEKAQLLRNLPGQTGAALAQIEINLGMNDEQLVNFYETHIKQHLKQETGAAGLSEHKFLGFLPPITMVGVGVGIQLQPDEAPVPVPGVAFAISIGSELVVFQKPNTSTEAQGRSADERMNADAEKDMKKFQERAAEAGKTVTFVDMSEAVVGDRASGMRPVRTESKTAESTPASSTEKGELDSAFAELRDQLQKQGMDLEPVNTKPPMYKLTVDNFGDLKLYVDPQMAQRTGVFLKDNQILISANQNPKLAIKRVDMYYPREKEGSIKHSFVTISDNAFRPMFDDPTNGRTGIISESDFYLHQQNSEVGEGGVLQQPQIIGTHENPTQFNLREWVRDPEQRKNLNFDYFENRSTPLEGTQETENPQKYAALAKSAREHLGLAEQLDADGVNKIRAKAEAFMKAHPKEYRQLTTFGMQKRADYAALNVLIAKDNPNLTPDELVLFKEELFNLSMSDTEKMTLPQKKAIMLERVERAKNIIYIPFFEERIKLHPETNPNNYTAEQLAEAFVGPLRTMALTNPEKIPLGARADVAVGTYGEIGQRGYIIANPDAIKNHGLYPSGKDYAEAFRSNKASIDKTIALIFRQNYNPEVADMDNERLLNTPMAMKLMNLGVKQNHPMLAEVLGEDVYKQLLECYPNGKGKATPKPGTEDAIAALKDLVGKLQEAQTGAGTKFTLGGNEYLSIEENGVTLGIRTTTFRSGVYERCLNAANIYEDEIIAFKSEQPPVIRGGMRFYNAQSVLGVSSDLGANNINLGFGATAPFRPRPVPPRPPERVGESAVPYPPKVQIVRPISGGAVKENAGTGDAGNTGGGGAQTGGTTGTEGLDN